jgi:Amt family ammonium transporter
MHIDDPVGAVSVHGVCGAWGTLAAGLFNMPSMGGFSTKVIGVQLLGIGSAFIWAFGTAFILFKVIDMVFGLRVSEEEEMMGVDITEHGAHAYDFQLTRQG